MAPNHKWKRQFTPIRCSTQPTFPGSLGAITTPFKFRVMPFRKQHVGLKALTFSLCASCLKPSERGKARQQRNYFFLLIRDKLFSSSSNTNHSSSKDESSWFVWKFPIYSEISYSCTASLFPSSHPTLLALIPQTFIQNLSCAVRCWNMRGKDKVEGSLSCGISPSIKKNTHVNRKLKYNMVNAEAITEFKVGAQESQIVPRSNDVW